MKTTLIRVLSSDDVLSIRDKIGWSNSRRILLIIPRNRRDFPDEVGLALINRAANDNGAVLGLVTQHSTIQDFAERIGVSVFYSVTQAERGVWGTSSVKNNYQPRYGIETLVDKRKELPADNRKTFLTRSTAIIIFGIMANLFILAAIFFIPSAKVIIYPYTQLQDIDLEVHASSEVKQNNPVGFIHADKKFLPLTGEMSAVSTGSVIIGKTKSVGEVIVSNQTIEPITLPKGSVFLTDQQEPVRFVSLKDEQIPGYGIEIAIAVEAENNGDSGNIGVGEIVRLEGNTGSSLVVRNDVAATGGSSINVPAPVDSDYAELREELLSDLQSKAVEQYLGTSTPDHQLILESVALDEIIDETLYNPIGEASDILKMSITARFSALYYNPNSLEDLLAGVMNISLPDDHRVVASSLLIEPLGEPNTNSQDEISWLVHASQRIYQDYSNEKLKRLISGKKVDLAIELINIEMPHTQPVEVESQIKWWPYLPLNLDRITLVERFLDEG